MNQAIDKPARTKSYREKTFLSFFILVNLILSSFFVDVWKTPNPVARALLVHSIVAEGTLAIDTYHDLTTDKGYIAPHFYSSKAPFSSLIVVPVYALRGWLAKSTWVFFLIETYLYPMAQLIIPSFLAGRINPNNLLTMFWGVEPIYAVWTWLLLFIVFIFLASWWFHVIRRKQNHGITA